MGIEQNKALMQRWVEEVLNLRKVEAIDELAAPSFVMHHTTMPQHPHEQLIDRQGYASRLPAIFAALPDLHVTIEAMIAEGDLVATLLRATGTHQNALRDIAPSHKPVVQPAVVLFRCADGQFVEAWEGERAWGITLPEAAQA
jgi:predicted ester cyclase